MTIPPKDWTTPELTELAAAHDAQGGLSDTGPQENDFTSASGFN